MWRQKATRGGQTESRDSAPPVRLDTAARAAPHAPYILAPAFLLLAGVMLVSGDPELPRAVSPEVDPKEFSDRPLRAEPRHPATIVRGGYEMACGECHGMFWSPAQVSAQLTQHQHIQLDHGLNDRCYNCHDRVSRDMLVLPGGMLIRYDESPRLCATCHGPTYRDWELGIHGRTVGSWDASSGKQSRLSCTQCHDPHAPAFGPMTLLPGPSTLRMRMPPSHDAEHAKSDDLQPAAAAGKRNPLKHWMKHEPRAPDDADHSAEEHQ